MKSEFLISGLTTGIIVVLYAITAWLAYDTQRQINEIKKDLRFYFKDIRRGR